MIFLAVAMLTMPLWIAPALMVVGYGFGFALGALGKLSK